ncbi:MAG: phage holin family protein [Patescibacteria group bacterium]
MKFIIRLIINALAVYLTSNLLAGISIDGFVTAIVVAVVLGIVNTLVKPILLLLTFPINFLTLGLFTWVINALMVVLVDYIVPGFSVSSFLWALLFSLVLSVISSILNKMIK